MARSDEYGRTGQSHLGRKKIRSIPQKIRATNGSTRRPMDSTFFGFSDMVEYGVGPENGILHHNKRSSYTSRIQQHLALHKRAGWRLMKMVGRVVFYLTCVFAGVGVYNMYTALIDWSPPVVFIEALAVQPSARAGEQITMRFDVDRKKICLNIRDDRFIIDYQGTTRIVSNYERVTQTRPGKEVYERSITIPIDVPPGPATYFIRINYVCTWAQRIFGPIVVESPYIPFVVLPKKEA